MKAAAYVIWSNQAAGWLDGDGDTTTNIDDAFRYSLQSARKIAAEGRVRSLLLAPESVDLMLTYIADQLDAQRNLIRNAVLAAGELSSDVPDEVAMATVATILDEPTAAPAFDAEALDTLHQSMAAAGLRIVAGPGPLRDVLPEAMGLLDEPTVAEVAAEKRSDDS